jgi:hypothetical protein
MDTDESSSGPLPPATNSSHGGETRCNGPITPIGRDRPSNPQKPRRPSRIQEDSFTIRLSKTRSLQMSERLGTSARRPRGRER